MSNAINFMVESKSSITIKIFGKSLDELEAGKKVYIPISEPDRVESVEDMINCGLINVQVTSYLYSARNICLDPSGRGVYLTLDKGVE